MSNDKIRNRIEACIRCAIACEHCAELCLLETNNASMAACYRNARDCAEICWMTAAFMSRDSLFAKDICDACAKLCAACAAECEKHEMDHCQKCAVACQHCGVECNAMSDLAA